MPFIWTPRTRDRQPAPGATLSSLLRGRALRALIPRNGYVESVERGALAASLGPNTLIRSSQYGTAMYGANQFNDNATGVNLPAGSCDLTGLTEFSVIAVCRFNSYTTGGDNGILRTDENANTGNAQLGFSFVIDSASQITWHSLVATTGTSGWSASTFVTDAAPPPGLLAIMMMRWSSGAPVESMWSLAGGSRRPWVSAAFNPIGTVTVTNGSAASMQPHIGGMAHTSGCAFPGDIYSVTVLKHAISNDDASRIVAAPFSAMFGPVRTPVFYSLSGGGGGGSSTANRIMLLRRPGLSRVWR